MSEDSPVLQSKPLPATSFPPLAGHLPLGKVLAMRDDDSTPEDGDGHDHDHADGSFYEEQYAWDKIDREAAESRRGSCLLLLLTLPAGAWLLLG